MNSNNSDLANSNDNGRMTWPWLEMKSYKQLYGKIVSLKNLTLAWEKARKGKNRKKDVIEFRENLAYNLKILYNELQNQTYKPKQLKNFILRDPKTRKISKSDFRDRIVHHALIRIIEPIFDKTFIHDSRANRKLKGTLFATNRFELFKRKVTNNLIIEAFCLKADIKHYFQEIDRDVLFKIISKKIHCQRTLNLIKLVLNNFEYTKGMPLGNLTSQFFANVYLNELDYFVKHELKAKYYIRYVDDFAIFHSSREQLGFWKEEINKFLIKNLRIELHKEKSKITLLSQGVDFIGFRNFYYFRLLRRRNIRTIKAKIISYQRGVISSEKYGEILQGWCAYAKWANSYNLTNKLAQTKHRMN